MTALPNAQERRSKRSNLAHQAITFQLEYVLKQSGLRNFTLSDANGLRIAYAGHVQESDAFAAHAPKLANCPDKTKRRQISEQIISHFIGDVDPKMTLHARRFIIDNEPMYLCVAGVGGAQLETCMWRAVSGIRRIYA